jgi:2,4-dienoyl-CoA reductase-like NADH-dependent reductase (Old Yellow Enzyme family)
MSTHQQPNDDGSIYLFQPVTIGNITLRNRIVMAPTFSGYATRDGFIHQPLYDYYVERAHGGVGLIVTEPMQVTSDYSDLRGTHIGLYADKFIPRLRHLADSVHGGGAKIIVTLEAPDSAATGSAKELTVLTVMFIQAAERVIQAGCDGVMLSAADEGVLHTIISPLRNNRYDSYSNTTAGRLRFPLNIIKGIRMFLGKHVILGFRMVAEEFAPGGMRLPTAQAIAQRIVQIGVNVIDVTTDTYAETHVARFPGWRIPLASSIKSSVPDTVIIGSDHLNNPYLAESFVRDGSVDLMMLERTIPNNPYWPDLAYIMLQSGNNDDTHGSLPIDHVF